MTHFFLFLSINCFTEVPDAPSIPVVVSVASRSLVVNWSEPRSNNVAITEYNLVFNYTYRNGSVIFRYMNITGKEMSGAVVSMATLSALVPFQTYSVTVRAVNAIGPGAFSNVLMVNTSQDGKLSTRHHDGSTIFPIFAGHIMLR